MSSSEEDIPLVRANGRANGKPYPPCDAAAYTPFGSLPSRTPFIASHHIFLHRRVLSATSHFQPCH